MTQAQTALASMHKLRSAYEHMMIAYYSSDNNATDWHFKTALDLFCAAAEVLGFDLVPRQPAPAPVAVEAQPEAVL